MTKDQQNHLIQEFIDSIDAMARLRMVAGKNELSGQSHHQYAAARAHATKCLMELTAPFDSNPEAA